MTTTARADELRAVIAYTKPDAIGAPQIQAARDLLAALEAPTNSNPKDNIMPAPVPKSANYSEQDHDDLYAAMYPGRAKPERSPERAPDDGRVRADVDRVSLSEVAAKYPTQEQRDELELALGLEQVDGVRMLSDDERPYAVALADETDRRTELAELTASARR
jgi:hypothetical protein